MNKLIDMRHLFFFLLIILFSVLLVNKSYSQNKGGFASLSGQAFINKMFDNRVGMNFTGGVGTSNKSTLGASIDLFVFGKQSKFVIPHLDARIFPQGLEKPNGVFISIQPGWIAYNKSVRIGSSTITTKGNLAFDILGGVYIETAKKFPGVVVSGGFSFMSFKTNQTYNSYPGGKIQLGIKF